MHYRNKTFVLISAVIAVLLVAGFEASADSLKDRMLARIPAINALKDQGLVGENNQGYLEYRSGNKPEQKLINDENNDRKSVYTAIAKKQGVDAGLVGQRRAKQIADIGASGHWFQKADGSWYKK